MREAVNHSEVCLDESSTPVLCLTALATLQDKSSLPAPNTESVSVSERPSGEYAAISFPGVAGPQAAAQKERELRALMQKRGVSAAGDEWYLARYNDPSTRPAWRKNEILVPVKDFVLWES